MQVIKLINPVDYGLSDLTWSKVLTCSFSLCLFATNMNLYIDVPVHGTFIVNVTYIFLMYCCYPRITNCISDLECNYLYVHVVINE